MCIFIFNSVDFALHFFKINDLASLIQVIFFLDVNANRLYLQLMRTDLNFIIDLIKTK